MKPYFPAIIILGFVFASLGALQYYKAVVVSAPDLVVVVATTTGGVVAKPEVEKPVVSLLPVAAPVVTTPAPVSTPSPPPPPPAPVPEPAPLPSGFTLAEVAAHNNRSSCWTAISGQVYDITSYINQHPGGSAVLRGCGVDGTSLFNKVGAHRGTIGQLAAYIIGNLI